MKDQSAGKSAGRVASGTFVSIVRSDPFSVSHNGAYMITKTEAIKLVEKELQLTSDPDNPLVVNDKYTVETSFGWVFAWNTQKFWETGKMEFGLVGNGRIVVNKNTGTVEFFASYKTIEMVIKECEQRAKR